MAAVQRMTGSNASFVGLKQIGRCNNCYVALAGTRSVVMISGVVLPAAERVAEAQPGDVRVTLLDGTQAFYRPSAMSVGVAANASFKALKSTTRRTRIWAATAGTYAGVPFADLSPDGEPVDLLYAAPSEEVLAHLCVEGKADAP